MGNGKVSIANKAVVWVLEKVSGKLTKENKKSDHEHLTIKIEGAESVNSFLAPTYLENLKKAINKVSIPKKTASLKNTRIYWNSLHSTLITEIKNLNDCLKNSTSINTKISSNINEILKLPKEDLKFNGFREELFKLEIKKAKLESEISKNNDTINSLKDNGNPNNLNTKFLHEQLRNQFNLYCKNKENAINSELQKLDELLSNSSPINFKKIKNLDELDKYINSIKDETLKNTANEALTECKGLADNVIAKSHQYKSYDKYVLKCFSDFNIHTGVHREKSFVEKYGDIAAKTKNKLSKLSTAISNYNECLRNPSDLNAEKKTLEKDLETLNTASDTSTKYAGNDQVIICYRKVFEIFNGKVTSRSKAERILDSFCCEQLKIESSSKSVILSNVIDIEQLKKDNEKFKKESEKISIQIKKELKNLDELQKFNITKHMKLMALVSPVENLLLQKKTILETAIKSLSSIISKAEEFKTNASDIIKAQHTADSNLDDIEINQCGLPYGKVNLYAFVKQLIIVLNKLKKENYKEIRTLYDSTISIKQDKWKKYNNLYDKVFPERKNITIFKNRYELCL